MSKRTFSKRECRVVAGFAKQCGAAFLALAVLGTGPALALSTYVVDGNIGDWGVSLQTAGNWRTTYFVSSSFSPSVLGSIDYVVEDRYPGSGEFYDYEALYFDDTADSVYVGVISSHPWDSGANTLLLTLNGITQYAADADAFAWSNLDKNERYRYTTYPNYFYEASWSKTAFGDVQPGDPVYVYANCDPTCCYYDRIDLCGTIDNPPDDTPPGKVIPEPATLALFGAGLAGLAGGALRKRGRRPGRQ